MLLFELSGGFSTPRPVSWLPRLHEIRRAVANSVRSHYDRRDLEGLFELQPRAAQSFFALLPSIQVGRSRLVEREALVRFLDGVQETDDVSAYMERVRKEGAEVSRKKIRSLVRSDIAPATLNSLPQSLSLRRGRLEVSFRSAQELAEAMHWLAQVLETPEFAREFEPVRERTEPEAQDDICEMFAEFEQMDPKGRLPGSGRFGAGHCAFFAGGTLFAGTFFPAGSKCLGRPLTGSNLPGSGYQSSL